MRHRLSSLTALACPAAFIGLGLLASGSDACGIDSQGKGEGEPCTRSFECRVGLVCTGGECRPAADGGFDGLDAGPVDAGPSDAGPSDAGPSDAPDAAGGPEADAGTADASPDDTGL